MPEPQARPLRDHPRWLAEEFSSQLATVLDAMSGERPAIEREPLTDPSGTPGFHWKQPFASVQGEIWLFAAESDWSVIGNQVLRAAGIEDADAPTLKSTYLETIAQALSGLARVFSGSLGREITPEGGAESDSPSSDVEWVALRVKCSAGSALLHFGYNSSLLQSFRSPAPTQPNTTAVGNGQPETSGALAFGKSKTFELLLDVELPVSVSFGRAQVPLKDVLKLTTGSIVELNRSIVEPVEVIVNNCVIARGEVVVIEGNFGVRIQQVISRQERLRTLT